MFATSIYPLAKKAVKGILGCLFVAGYLRIVYLEEKISIREYWLHTAIVGLHEMKRDLIECSQCQSCEVVTAYLHTFCTLCNLTHVFCSKCGQQPKDPNQIPGQCILKQ